MTPHVFFQFLCDDSGNTGPDFIEAGQPVYVEAGWIIPVAKIKRVEQHILDFEASLPGQGAEKKANRVLRNPAGLAATAKLFESLREASCIPVFVLAEKRYCIAAKMVETFLDSEFNNSVDAAELWDTKGRQDIAEVFYNLPFDRLVTFAKAYRSNDLNALTLSAQDVSALLAETSHKVLALKILDCLPHLSKMCRLEKQSDTWLPNGGMKALNTPVLISLFSMIEGHGKRTRTRIDMIHDDTPYQAALEKVFKQYKESMRTQISLPNGTGYFGYRHLTSLRFERSVSTPLVRAADFLAGSISQYTVSKINGSQLQPGLVALANMVIPEAFDHELGWVLVSYKYARSSLAPLQPSA